MNTLSPEHTFSPAPEAACQGRFFSAADLATALGKSKKSIHRIAVRENWHARQDGNRFEYAPPEDVAEQLSGILQFNPEPPGAAPRVGFTEIARDPEQAAKVRLKEQAVLLFHEARVVGIELALRQVVAGFKALPGDPIKISVASLRRWSAAYTAHGLNGLVEQKLGFSGRKGVFVPDEIANLGKAMAIEMGDGRRPNVARAARALSTHPELPAELRYVMHEGRASKSYVNPSVRRALTPSYAAMRTVQGPRAARLAGRFTPTLCDAKPGCWFTADDMTSNVVCWVETEVYPFFRVGQAQILPVIDIGSLRWLAVRVIMRPGGQYNAQDDIWGLFGDVFDIYGLPEEGFVLEGGHWQANAVKGHRTAISDEDRIGGLASLGLKMRRSHDPRNKIIEGQFHLLQSEMDRMPGFVGRDQRTQLPEATKHRLAKLSAKNPEVHPMEWFPHITALADQVQASMERLNHERQEGMTLRGASPLEKWAEHATRLRAIPDTARWMYRSTMSLPSITANGIRVAVGSGKKQQVYYYDNPALLVPLHGRKVICHWNHERPEADAILRDLHTRKILGCAQLVERLSRFDATPEQLAKEGGRKREASQIARTEIRAIQPHLQRTSRQIPVDGAAREIGRRIDEAGADAAAVQRTRKAIRRVSPEDLAAASDTILADGHRDGTSSGVPVDLDDFDTEISAERAMQPEPSEAVPSGADEEGFTADDLH